MINSSVSMWSTGEEMTEPINIGILSFSGVREGNVKSGTKLLSFKIDTIILCKTTVVFKGTRLSIMES